MSQQSTNAVTHSGAWFIGFVILLVVFPLLHLQAAPSSPATSHSTTIHLSTVSAQSLHSVAPPDRCPHIAQREGYTTYMPLVVNHSNNGTTTAQTSISKASSPTYPAGHDFGDGIPTQLEMSRGDTDGDGIPDYMDADDDGDCVPTSVEEGRGDSDGDGIPDYLDYDDDNDGIPTWAEDYTFHTPDSTLNYAVRLGQQLVSNDNAPLAFIPQDIWGDGNPLNDDTDNDGTPDYRDPDDDGDGVLTIDEFRGDTDENSRPDHIDVDDDGDGLPTIDESRYDTNGNGVPDYRDASTILQPTIPTPTTSKEDTTPTSPIIPTLTPTPNDVSPIDATPTLSPTLDVLDDDGDGIPNDEELQGDTDGDGIPNYLDFDDDGDGVFTKRELPYGDTDGDGIPNYLDFDDDGDGVFTKRELPYGDTDGDGIPDYLDTDDDGDGIPTKKELPQGDTDGDAILNYLDPDDDGDLVLTIDELACGDPNGNGIPAHLDPEDKTCVITPTSTNTSVAPAPTETPVQQVTVSPKNTPTNTPVKGITISPSITPTSTDTPTKIPTNTPVVPPTDIPTPTNTPVVPPTDIPTPTNTPVVPPTDIPTPTNKPPNTPTAIPTPTNTPVVPPTGMPTPTNTPVVPPTDMPTPTNTPVVAPMDTPTPTNTPVVAPTDMPTPTNTPVVPPTATPMGPTPTPTPIPASNTKPIANAQTVSGDEDTDLIITLTGSDPDGDTRRYFIASLPTKGSLYQVDTDGTSRGVEITAANTEVTNSQHKIIFVPAENEYGSSYTTFTFKVNDGKEDSAAATVTVDIDPINDAPVANAQTTNGEEDTDLIITLTGSDVDNDPLTYIIASLPTNGSLYQTDGTSPGAEITTANTTVTNDDNKVIFVPAANENGSSYDSFTFKVNDGTVDSDAATVTVDEISAINDAPVNTVPDGQTTIENGLLTFSTGKGNAIQVTDVDSASDSIKVTLTASNGTLTLAATSGLLFSTGSGVNDANMTFTGTVANINTALDGMVFTPTIDYTGDASVQITTDDQGYTGTGGAKTDDDTVAIKVSGIIITKLDYSYDGSTLTVEWETNGDTTGQVDYGTDTSYGTNVEDTTSATTHSVDITGLNADTLYHFQVSATDGVDTVTSPDIQFKTSASTDAYPIDVWYGNYQAFGHKSKTQTWVNILGNTIASPLTYSLNGGAEQELSLGPNAGFTGRLTGDGDFNVDICRYYLNEDPLPEPPTECNDLNDGLNTVTLNAGSGSYVRTVIVNYNSSATWTMPTTAYTIDWSTFATMEDIVSATSGDAAGIDIVDGEWELSGGEICTVIPGYDRLIAIGDMTWDDYEVKMPITAAAFNSSQDSIMGLMMRWHGHYVDVKQPHLDWYPIGAFLHYFKSASTSTEQIRIRRNGYGAIVGADRTLNTDTTYWFKARVETSGGVGKYYLKVWQGSDEPAEWDLTGSATSEELADGSFLLVAHYTDLCFGDVTISPATP